MEIDSYIPVDEKLSIAKTSTLFSQDKNVSALINNNNVSNDLSFAQIAQRLPEYTLHSGIISKDIKINYCDEKGDPNYRIYGGMIGQVKVYLIELKQPKENGSYNFCGFKPEKDGAVFIINFTCPEKSRLNLPLHMECFVIPQKNVSIEGNFTNATVTTRTNEPCFTKKVS